MLTQGPTSPVVEARNTEAEIERNPNELEEILITNQRIIERLGRIDERLSMISCRLSGEVPREVATDGADPPLSGIIGQLKTTHAALFRHCDSIEEWLTHIEKVI